MVSGYCLAIQGMGSTVRLHQCFQLFIVQFFWTGSYVAMKWASDEMPIGIVVFLRYGGASLGFLVWNLFTGWPRWHRADLGLLALLGSLTFALAPTLQISSLRYTQAVDVSILIALEPLMTVFVATLILKEKISRKTTLTLTIATVGMFVLSSVGPPYYGEFTSNRLLGNLLFLTSLFFEVAVTVTGRRLTSRYRPRDAVQAMMSARFLTASIVYTGRFPRWISRRHSFVSGARSST